MVIQGAFLAVSITNKHFPNIVTGEPGVSYVNNGQGLNPTGGSTDTDNAISKYILKLG